MMGASGLGATPWPYIEPAAGPGARLAAGRYSYTTVGGLRGLHTVSTQVVAMTRHDAAPPPCRMSYPHDATPPMSYVIPTHPCRMAHPRYTVPQAKIDFLVLNIQRQQSALNTAPPNNRQYNKLTSMNTLTHELETRSFPVECYLARYSNNKY